jgi:hypothetical protein
VPYMHRSETISVASSQRCTGTSLYLIRAERGDRSDVATSSIVTLSLKMCIQYHVKNLKLSVGSRLRVPISEGRSGRL